MPSQHAPRRRTIFLLIPYCGPLHLAKLPRHVYTSPSLIGSTCRVPLSGRLRDTLLAMRIQAKALEDLLAVDRRLGPTH